MPRPNRYHPYINDPQLPSSRYSPWASPPRSKRPIRNTKQDPQPLAPTYQYIPPDYIRGVTIDGKALVARSIIQAADGILHVQMQIASFPPEHAVLRNNTPVSSPTLALEMPSWMGMETGVKREDASEERKDSVGADSQDDGNRGKIGEECNVQTDEGDMDAEGEDDDMDEEQWRANAEQTRQMEEGAMDTWMQTQLLRIMQERGTGGLQMRG